MQNIYPLYQSFMTSPEWKNVEISEDFADFLAFKKPLYDFMYLREAYETNRIFFYAVYSSLKYNKLSEIVWPQNGNYNYFIMDLFVVIMTNMSMLFSSMYCTFVNLLMIPYRLWSIFSKDSMLNDTEFQQVATKYYTWYVKELNVMPFYNVDYQQALVKLKEDYKNCNQKSWTDFWTMGYMFLELQSKIFLSYFMKTESNCSDVTPAIAKFTSSENIQMEDAWVRAITSFHQKLNNQIKDQDKISLGKATEESFWEITTPRYHDFRQALQAFAEHGIEIETIAGQERILVKFIYEFKDTDDLKKAASNISRVPDVHLLYQYPNIIKRNQMFFMLDLPTRSLNTTINSIEKQNFSTRFIHNF